MSGHDVFMVETDCKLSKGLFSYLLIFLFCIKALERTNGMFTR